MNPDSQAKKSRGPTSGRWWRWSIDLGTTLLLWTYFTIGFLIFFAPLYLFSAALPGRRMAIWQTLNHFFYRSFFQLCRLLMPRQRWQIDPMVKAVRASVIVCNHLSYIDPILLISLFARHTTIVKARLFRIPIFGLMLRLTGYIPSAADRQLAGVMVARMETLCADLAGGANLIVFPEGTRSRDGAIGPFNAGAFKIARRCRLPIQVILIRNSQRLFTPGRFLFNTLSANTISVVAVGRIMPDYDDPAFSLSRLIHEVRERMVMAAETA
ncbi:Acyltransferase [Desulfosarcina cetonica]|nr:Acyltransferase [Desulfosarcina cetonica]